MLKGAIIGLGNVAINGHLPGWEGCGQAKVVAAVDALESRLAQERWRLPGARFYTGVSAMLAAEALDFLDVCTPPGTHASISQMALRRGLHVLCEKPLVLSPGELQLVRSAQVESGRVLYTVHNWLYAPIISKTTALIREGTIGIVRRIRWQVLRREPSVAVGPQGSAEACPELSREGAIPANWRLDPAMAGGGILLDHGWHALYIVLSWLCQTPGTISAVLEKRTHPEWPVEDTATVRLNSSEATVEIFLTWASSLRNNSAVIEGTLGTIHVDDDTLRLTGAGAEQCWTFEQPLSQGSHHPDWFSRVRDDFLGEISGEAQQGKNLAEASLCAQLLHLAKESHGQGGKALAL
ncbi:Oxidoreductase domain protein [Candidatus Methylomirabilis lanthanidiphila]|uniref:Oxidoreductase domain protein n=1 Tax=Candidatus Methylomirabilis lanthanidiphila TaxID=2211376 RepID=A0A564ZP53_9BACT|nr:Gfo/Idh/MocA family oxidoreductase [Candidatus Methylomirabilis lanthanidiphila]VUZ86432.1 Oxidoreductase domain protein [Candidatus Methylomirabilis lanthanidiphila]